jgi:Ca-activated chloride channel family protein
VHDNPALTAIWARSLLRDLEDAYAAQGYGDTAPLEQRITTISLRFGVLCRFTAYVAVDSRVVTQGGEPRKVVQPVDLPSGWEPQAPRPAMPMHVSLASAAAPLAFNAPVGGYGSAAPTSVGGAMPYPSAPPSVSSSAPYPDAAPPGAAPQIQPAPNVKRRKESSEERRTGGLRGFGRRRSGPSPSDSAIAPEPPSFEIMEEAGYAVGAETVALLVREAERLRAGVDRPDYERVEMLEDLGSRLAALNEPGLRDLVEWLSPERLRQHSLAESWAHTLAVLDALTSGAPTPTTPGGRPAASGGAAPTPPTRAAFWKR